MLDWEYPYFGTLVLINPFMWIFSLPKQLNKYLWCYKLTVFAHFNFPIRKFKEKELEGM